METPTAWADDVVPYYWTCDACRTPCADCARRPDLVSDTYAWQQNIATPRAQYATRHIQQLNSSHRAFKDEHGRARRVLVPTDILSHACLGMVSTSAQMDMAAADRLEIMVVVSCFDVAPHHHFLERWPDHVAVLLRVRDQADADQHVMELLRFKMWRRVKTIGVLVTDQRGPVDLTAITFKATLLPPVPANGTYDVLAGFEWPQRFYKRKPVPARLDCVFADRCAPSAIADLERQCAAAEVPFTHQSLAPPPRHIQQEAV